MRAKTLNVLLMVAFLAAAPLCDAGAEGCCIGIRGNVDYDAFQEIDIADLVYLVDYMFSGGPEPPCYDEADMDGSGGIIDVADLIYLVHYMFTGGPEPVACPPDVIEDVMVPLTIGNWWSYEVTEFNQSGTIVDEYDTTATISGDTLIGDSTWFFLEGEIGGLSGIVTNMDNGTWSFLPDSTPSEALVLKYPATVGDAYPYYDVTVHIDAIDAPVTVPAGTFSCYYYRLTAPIVGTVGKIWAEPNVGIVKAEMYDLYIFTVYLKTRAELLSYGLVVQ